MESDQAGTLWNWQRVAWWAAVAIAFTSWSIQYSYEHGRLVGAPGFDDVGYFCDGLDRLDEFYVHGWKGVTKSYFKNPPHAPFSSTLAALSFGLFGLHEWAPYAANGLLVFVLIAFCEWLLHGAALWLRVAAVALVLSVPLTQKAVTEFRPDVAVAILTAMGVVMAVRRSLITSDMRHTLAVGAVFGLALLVKPTMCVLTGFLCGLSLGAAFVCDWYVHRPEWRPILIRYAAASLTTLAVAAPYYAVNGKHVFEYIYRNIFGSAAATWQIQATRSQHLLYYLTGPGAVEMLDNSVWILVPLLLTGFLHVLARRDKETIVRTAGLTLCLLGAYAVPTASACKHGFYGLAFFCLATFAAVLSLRQIYALAPSPGPGLRWLTATALVIAAAVALWQYPHAGTWGTRGDGTIGSSRQVCDDIIKTLIANQTEPNSVVLTTAECQYANMLTLQWCARKNGHSLRFQSPPMNSDLAGYRQTMERCDIDFVIAFSTEKPLMQFASERQANEILALARSLPHLVEVQSFCSYGGVVYYVFKNTQPAFSGSRNLEGLGPVEGPFPQWGLPRVRWGLGQESKFHFTSKDAAPMRLSMSCRSDAVDQTLTVLVDGKEVYRAPFEAKTEFTAVDVPLPVTTAGEHELTLQYGACNSISESRRLAMLFERLQVLPINQK